MFFRMVNLPSQYLQALPLRVLRVLLKLALRGRVGLLSLWLPMLLMLCKLAICDVTGRLIF